MFLVADTAQLAHVADNGHFVRMLDADKVLQGCSHAGGVGVVVVGDDGIATFVLHLRAVVGGLVLGDGGANVLFAHSKMLSNCCCCQHIIQVVSTSQLGVYLLTEQFNADETVVADNVTVDIRCFFGGVGYDGLIIQIFCKDIIINIDKQSTFAAHNTAVQGFLGGDDILFGKEAFDMGGADVSDETVIGQRQGAKVGDFAWVVSPHLHNGHLMLIMDAEQSEGHTDMVIQVALGIADIVFLWQYGGYQLFGSGFAIGTRNANNWNL